MFSTSYQGEVTATSLGMFTIPLPNSGVTHNDWGSWCVSVYLQIKSEPAFSDHSTIVMSAYYSGIPHSTLKEYSSSAVVRNWNSDKEYLTYRNSHDDTSRYSYVTTVALDNNSIIVSLNNYKNEVKNKTYYYVVNVYDIYRYN